MPVRYSALHIIGGDTSIAYTPEWYHCLLNGINSRISQVDISSRIALFSSEFSEADMKSNLSHTSISSSRLLQLPAELRLKIYEYALDVPNEYLVSKPMIVLGDRGKTFTARGQYRALSMSPHWVGEDGTARKLLAVNRQLHDEAEDYLYSTHTLFLRNSFNLDRLADFLDTLSATARARIRSVGFEVFFFVHTQTGVPKRTLKQYEAAARLLSEKLPLWNSVLLYLDPRYYYPSANVGGRDLTARGVFDLATRFGTLCKDVSFYPLPNGDQHLLDEAQQFVWRSRSPLRQSDNRRSIKGCSAWSLDFKKKLVAPSRVRPTSSVC